MIIHDIEVNLQIWDTAGQERFHTGSIGSAFYRGAHGALLVYDVNNEKSIEQVAQWRDECLSRKETGEEVFFPIVVVGNKIDLRDVIPQDERVDQSGITQWCRENQYGHIETSAKDGHGVEAAMMAVVGLALESIRAGNIHGNRRMTSISGNHSSIVGGLSGLGGTGLSQQSHHAINRQSVDLKTLYQPKPSSSCGCK
jgi:small GTP-binding protein